VAGGRKLLPPGFADQYRVSGSLSSGVTYHNLGTVSKEQKKWQEAESYYQQALQIYIEYQDRYNQTIIYGQLGILAKTLRQREKASACLLDALERLAHDMRNEFARMFQPAPRGIRSAQQGWETGQREEKWREKREKEKKEHGDEGQSSKGDRTSRSEMQVSPRDADGSRLPEEMSGGGQAEKGCQAVWNPEQGERNPLRLIRSSIASQSLIP